MGFHIQEGLAPRPPLHLLTARLRATTFWRRDPTAIPYAAATGRRGSDVNRDSEGCAFLAVSLAVSRSRATASDHTHATYAPARVQRVRIARPTYCTAFTLFPSIHTESRATVSLHSKIRS